MLMLQLSVDNLVNNSNIQSVYSLCVLGSFNQSLLYYSMKQFGDVTCMNMCCLLSWCDSQLVKP